MTATKNMGSPDEDPYAPAVAVPATVIANPVVRCRMRSAAAEFEAAMGAAGLKVPPAGVKADGKFHRCDVEGEGGEGEGSYQLDLEGIPTGSFQNHRDGARVRRWHARMERKYTSAEIAAFKEKVRLQKSARDADLAQQQEETAKRAAVLIEGSEDAPGSHPYLVKKEVQAHGLRFSANPVALSPCRQSAPDVLLVPMYDSEGTLWNAQLIDSVGTTSFLKPGRITGCFFVIGKSGPNFARSGLNRRGLNLICVDYATAATCFEAIGRQKTLAASR